MLMYKTDDFADISTVMENDGRIGVIYKNVSRAEWLFLSDQFTVGTSSEQLKQISKKLKELNE